MHLATNAGLLGEAYSNLIYQCHPVTQGRADNEGLRFYKLMSRITQVRVPVGVRLWSRLPADCYRQPDGEAGANLNLYSTAIQPVQYCNAGKH
ncbi:hypothetical protein ElyMa_003722300 [Elysia marginata]|uniref:Uncharacterized protein n=1 Tax=Elysia marginata TaxID=1093978 RepID=A0AAV4F5Q4_9GAST|nr:hypothetical protein ElyMa_003722300 [Elysia marginata]